MYREDDFKSKIISTDKLLNLIEPGNRIFLTSGPAMPAISAREIVSSEKSETMTSR